MSEIIIALSSLNVAAAVANVWLLKNRKSSICNRLETQVVERAVELYKNLRDEYDKTINRLQERLEAQEIDNIALRKKVTTLTEQAETARTRELEYKNAITRLDKEITILRQETNAARENNTALTNQLGEYEKTIQALQKEWVAERTLFLEQQHFLAEEVAELRRHR